MAVSSLALVSIEGQIFIDKMIHKRLGHAGTLLGILEDVQAHHPHKYLPFDVLRYIALKTESPFRRSIVSPSSVCKSAWSILADESSTRSLPIDD